MTCRSTLAGLMLSCATAAAAVASDDLPPPRFTGAERASELATAWTDIDRIGQAWADEKGFPGYAWGVVVDGKLAHFGSAGYRDVDRKLPIADDTVFRIASMTKSFTALAILMLRDEGRVELDAPVSRYIPEFASQPPSTTDAGPVTVRHLLTHSAGFPEDNPWGDRQLAIPDATLDKWLRDGIPFATATGTAYEYSNYGFALLGRIVANVSGMRYPEFVRQKIFVPLGMTSTWFDVRDVPKERLALGYRRDGERFVAEAPLGDGTFGAMGGMFTTPRDLSRWVAFMLDAYPARDDPESGPALRRSVREMQRGGGFPLVRTSRTGANAPVEGGASEYGFGLSVARSCEFGRRISHSGGLPGWGSDMRWLPDSGVGLIGFANETYAAAGGRFNEMFAALRRSGGLRSRAPQPAPALVRAADVVAGALDTRDDTALQRIAADNLFLDEPLASRRKEWDKLRAGLGACQRNDIVAENALRGTFRVQCAAGWLDVTLTLAPTQPPTVQALAVKGGRPATASMQRTIDAVLTAISMGPRSLDVARGADRNAMGALLAATRETHGACRVNQWLSGDGTQNARVLLACDRGPIELTVERKGERLSALRFDAPVTADCVP